MFKPVNPEKYQAIRKSPTIHGPGLQPIVIFRIAYMWNSEEKCSFYYKVSSLKSH